MCPSLSNSVFLSHDLHFENITRLYFLCLNGVPTESYGESSFFPFRSVNRRSSEQERCFCQVRLPLVATHSGKVTEMVWETVDGDPGVRRDEHIFVGSKASWYGIADALPQFEEWPPGMEPLMTSVRAQKFEINLMPLLVIPAEADPELLGNPGFRLALAIASLAGMKSNIR
jgi:hypothetical protein